MGYLPDPDLLRGGTLTKGGRLRDKTPPPPKAGWDRDLGAQRLILIGLVWQSAEGWGTVFFLQDKSAAETSVCSLLMSALLGPTYEAGIHAVCLT